MQPNRSKTKPKTIAILGAVSVCARKVAQKALILPPYRGVASVAASFACLTSRSTSNAGWYTRRSRIRVDSSLLFDSYVRRCLLISCHFATCLRALDTNNQVALAKVAISQGLARQETCPQDRLLMSKIQKMGELAVQNGHLTLTQHLGARDIRDEAPKF
eukprot:COSAG01_NODE_927_length_12693_cov_16.333810_7_plen_160_part_00